MSKLMNILNSIIASVVGVLAPLKGIILIIIFSVFIDFILAIYNACKKGIPITSRKMFQTIPKLSIYICVIILVYYSNLFIFEVPIEIHKIIAGFILMTELKSIDENINLILGYSMFNKIIGTLSRGKNPTKI